MFVLTDSQQVEFGFVAVTVAGNKAPVENVVVESSDESVIKIVEVGGGRFKAVTTGKLLHDPDATVQISAKADALIGEGEEWIYGVTEVKVVPGRAVKIDLSFEAPSERPIDADDADDADDVVS